eukprot:1138851-Pelagomonas_calceolata.AAC.4
MAAGEVGPVSTSIPTFRCMCMNTCRPTSRRLWQQGRSYPPAVEQGRPWTCLAQCPSSRCDCRYMQAHAHVYACMKQYIRACRREGKGWAGGVPEEGTHGLHSSATKQQVQP